MQEINEQALLDNADALLASLDRWGWPEYPERPENLQADQELWTAYRKYDRGDKIGREDKEQLLLLASWRSAVLHLETVTAGKIWAIVGAVYCLEHAQQVDADGKARFLRMDDADQLRHHLRQCFRLKLPEPCPLPWHGWTRRLCQHFARNTQLLPDHLRRMVRPPADQGWKRDEPVRQSGFGVAEED